MTMQQEQLEKFTKQNKPKGRISKLEEFRLEIIDLRDYGYSYEQIRDYLIEYKKTSVDKTTICKYYKNLESKAKKIPALTVEIEQKTSHISTPAKATLKEQDSNNKIQPYLKQKKSTSSYIPPPPKSITDENFLNLCDDDQIVYCYFLFLAEYVNEAERLINLPGVDSVSRMLYRTKTRRLYERCHMKESKYEPDD